MLDRMADTDTNGTRRRPHEVRQLILDRAAAHFAEHGYANASVREIGREAGVSKSVIYRHFPTKAELFRETSIAPFLGFLEEFTSTMQSVDEDPVDDLQLTTLYFRELHDNLRAHRKALISLIALSDELEPELLADVQSAIARVVGSVGIMAIDEADRLQMSVDHVSRITQLAMALTIGVTMMEPLLPDDGIGPEDMAALSLFGVRLRPEVSEPATPAVKRAASGTTRATRKVPSKARRG